MSSGLKTLRTFHPGGGGTMPNTITETTSGTKFNLAAIQQALRENKIDGWLFYDHHHRDPLAYSIPGLTPKLKETPRWPSFLPPPPPPPPFRFPAPPQKRGSPAAVTPTPPQPASQKNSSTASS